MHLPVGLSRALCPAFFCDAPVFFKGALCRNVRLGQSRGAAQSATRKRSESCPDVTDAIALSILAAFFIALGIVLSQIGLRGLPALIGASVSVPTSAGLFVILSALTFDPGQWHTGSALIFAAAGLVYPAAVTLLNFASNRRLGPNLTAAMGNLTPLFAISLAIALLGEVPRAGQWLGIAAILGGLLMIASDRLRTHPARHLWLLLIPLFGAFLRGAAQPLVKLGLDGWPNALAAATIGYLVSSAVIWTARTVVRPEAPVNAGRKARWFVAIGLSNGIGLLCLYAALAVGTVTVVAPLVATYPLITMGLNRVILRDRAFSARVLAGIVVSVAGVVLLLTL